MFDSYELNFSIDTITGENIVTKEDIQFDMVVDYTVQITLSLPHSFPPCKINT